MAVNPILSEGDKAPEFSLPSDTDGIISLADMKGQKFILYFYPKDMTPGCTKQACGFRDNIEAFAEKGYKILGVSPDPVKRHAKFREKHDLNFPLLADEDHQVAETYGVYREKTNYGKTYMGIVRSTFFIDEEGRIEAIHDNVRATGHVERLLGNL